MLKIPENLDGPLFPHGFDGHDEDIDLGTHLPETEDERQLFRTLDIRLSELDALDPSIPPAWFDEANFIFARQIERGERFDEIAEAWQGKGMSLEERTIAVDNEIRNYLVVKKESNV